MSKSTDGPPPWLWVAKALLLALLVIGAVFPEVGGFAGKGMAFRLAVFGVPALAVPVWRWVRPGPYPAALDAALTLPFLVDTAANGVGLYDNWNPTDDVLHVVNWVILLWGLTAHLASSNLARGARPALLWLCGFGLGALAIVGWEAAEWLVMQAGVGGLHLTYDDTIGDLLLSTAGGGIGAALAVTRRPTAWRVGAGADHAAPRPAG